MIRDTTAWLLTSAMQDDVKMGTGTACQLDRIPVVGKTGTTEDYNDLLFVGYTPYYTCAVQAGYDNNSQLPEYARKFQQVLWKKVMTRIHWAMPYKDFPMPSAIQTATVCSETGLLADDGCPSYTEYFEPGTVPTHYVSGHYNSRYYHDDEDGDEDELESQVTRTSQDTSWVPSEIDILDTNELPTLDGEQTDREDIVDGSSYEYGDDGGDDDTFIPDNSWDQRRQR